ncbi:unnamed protein product [Adineta steineri]|uniref:Uncharacterized protein n=1 Tax=Adineta steineri TaxID=433720 RepID=A0A815YZW2_9BILA|nr:unnamed protein product [Adineta steineri]CAF1576320.1 unnamed protein product [Adineta steineri]
MSIPYIENVYFQSVSSNSDVTVRFNNSCQECLCESRFGNISNNDYVALNCFTNNTCQFFQYFPTSYKLSMSNGTRLYFLQQQFPNASKCCISNITELMDRLKTVTPTTINLTFKPAAFGYDSSIPSEAAVIGYDPGNLYWFNPLTTAFIRNSSIDTILTLALYENQTFTANNGISVINIRDKQTNNYINNVSYPSLGSVRKIIFINDGQTMIVSTQNNLSLTVFDINSPMNYTYREQIPVPLLNAHGIAQVNDTFLYVSSWSDQSIASCEYENSMWNQKIFVNYTITTAGSHIAVDDCERVWFINTQFGLRIYDSSGTEISNWNMSLSSTNTIYDILLLPNYVLLITHVEHMKIVQYDPQMTCS